jgi:hypothetical protein
MQDSAIWYDKAVRNCYHILLLLDYYMGYDRAVIRPHFIVPLFVIYIGYDRSVISSHQGVTSSLINRWAIH